MPVRARRTSVRRTLVLPAVALVVSLLGLTGCGDGAPSTAPAVPTAPTTPTTPTAPASPACAPGSRPVQVQLDTEGYVRFADLLVDWADHRATRVSLRHHTLTVLRGVDGPPYEIVQWHQITHRHPLGAPIWFVDGLIRCRPGPSASFGPVGSLVGAIVTLRVGHCWIDPVRIAGARWAVAAEDQRGWGDGPSRGFTGHGVALPAGDVMLYRDRAGATLTLVHADSPWALKRYGCA